MSKAFTLIELLVVVLIIGILAAVAVPQYRIAVAKSRYATLKDLAESIRQAEEIYYLANGEYVSNFEALDIQMPGGKKNNSSNYYTYDWGYCVAGTISNSKARVCCNNSKAALSYCIFFDHSPQFAGERYCNVYATSDPTDWHHKICQMETKSSNYTTVFSEYFSYLYTK